MVKIGSNVKLIKEVYDKCDERGKYWTLRYLSSEDPKKQIVQGFPYKIPATDTFEVEVGALPDGEYSLSCGTYGVSVVVNGMTRYGTQATFFSVINGEVVYPEDPSGTDRYYRNKKKNLPNMGVPKRGGVAPVLNVPAECLTPPTWDTTAQVYLSDRGIPMGTGTPEDFMIEVDGTEFPVERIVTEDGSILYGAKCECAYWDFPMVIFVRRK